jgi:hypothetical protein
LLFLVTRRALEIAKSVGTEVSLEVGSFPSAEVSAVTTIS